MTPRRSRLLFVALVVGQLFLVAAQARDPRDAHTSMLEGGVLRAVAPIAGLVSSVAEGFRALGDAVRTRATLEDENRLLRAEVAELRRQRLRLSGLELEVEELARKVGLPADPGLDLRAARVVHFDRRSTLRTLVVETGAAGARRDQPVVASSGLVGRVVEVAGRYAKVQLITDRAASVGVLLRTARRQGVLRGAGPGRLEVDYVPRQIRVEPGELVVTAGIDGVYPRGLPVGTVIAVGPGDESFQRVVVEPAVDFGDLSLVYLLDSARPPAELVVEETGDAVP
ncbi:MAG TPA: rod shape-determining protein MreC [Thermoanaerobaculia bacterium]|nr:rod shape-determining protein MreC [Thermoanaerobaculia bacterium]